MGALAALPGEDGFDARLGFGRRDVVPVAVGEFESAVPAPDHLPMPFVHAAMAAVAAEQHPVVEVGGSFVVPLVHVVGVAAFGRRPATSTAAVSRHHGAELVGREGAGGTAERE